MSQPVVSRCVTETCDAITTVLLPIWVTFPANDNERDAIKKGFGELDNRFSDTVFICESKQQILNINVRFPGSVRDSVVWMII